VISLRPAWLTRTGPRPASSSTRGQDCWRERWPGAAKREGVGLRGGISEHLLRHWMRLKTAAEVRRASFRRLGASRAGPGNTARTPSFHQTPGATQSDCWQPPRNSAKLLLRATAGPAPARRRCPVTTEMPCPSRTFPAESKRKKGPSSDAGDLWKASGPMRWAPEF